MAEDRYQTVTMIWNDCHCCGVSDHHWHTCSIDFYKHCVNGTQGTVEAVMYDYYLGSADHEEHAREMVAEASTDYGLVGIFKGVPDIIDES